MHALGVPQNLPHRLKGVLGHGCLARHGGKPLLCMSKYLYVCMYVCMSVCMHLCKNLDAASRRFLHISENQTKFLSPTRRPCIGRNQIDRNITAQIKILQRESDIHKSCPQTDRQSIRSRLTKCYGGTLERIPLSLKSRQFGVKCLLFAPLLQLQALVLLALRRRE